MAKGFSTETALKLRKVQKNLEHLLQSLNEFLLTGKLLGLNGLILQLRDDLKVIVKAKGEVYPELTKSEAAVVAFILMGLSNKEIGEKLFVSVKTVKFHANNIYKKLGVKSRSELIARHQEVYEQK